ncbi:MAG: hypothetical protein FJ215_05095 [Ignavibacteria bacterium]|nr:hypothetical protein [Ignavibacteria bacterium]
MPIDCWVDAHRKRICAVVRGEFSIDDIVHAIDTAIHDPAFERGFDIFSDHTQVTRNISTQQVKFTSAHLARLSDHLVGSRWAVVTGSELSYGMMRMLSAHLDQASVTLRVFRSSKDAEAWLAKPNPARPEEHERGTTT